jgi:glutathione peroxidase-family protein
MSHFHELEMRSITGEPVSFSQFKGKLCLIVNVATL